MNKLAAAPPRAKQNGPFDIIVITSPNAQAALVVQELIVSSRDSFHVPLSQTSTAAAIVLDPSPSASECEVYVMQSVDTRTLVISVCVPYGCRMGSGGETIAALAEADEVYHQWQQNQQSVQGDTTLKSKPLLPTVLICHDTGESSHRFPFVPGKACASLPVAKQVNNDETSPLSDAAHDVNLQSSAAMTNPISMLVSSLSNTFSDVFQGSVIVAAASDFLLSWFDNDTSLDNAEKTIDFDYVQENHGLGPVIGLAVPALAKTAENHRVHVLKANDPFVREKRWKVQPTLEILEQPKLEDMIGRFNMNTGKSLPPLANCTFSLAWKNDLMTWIDTGVIAFLPESAGTLRELSKNHLKCCTRSGLRELYAEKYDLGRNDNGGNTSKTSDQVVESTTSLKEFAQETAREICLYKDVLRAIRAPTYLPGSLSAKLSILSEHEFELYTGTIPTGVAL